MDFPVIRPNQLPHDPNKPPSPPHNPSWSMESQQGMYVGTDEGNLPKKQYQYSALFDQNGIPIHKIRSDGILGPAIMFVNTDLQTASFLGSVMLLVPNICPQPTVVFYDGVAPNPFYGRPTTLGSYQASGFIRYDFSIPLEYNIEKTITYRINDTPETYNFSIPSQTSQWRWCFYTCNGWSLNVKTEAKEALGGNDVVWDDLLNKHKKAPFHVMVGGGDQLYCDLMWNDPIWDQWFSIKSKSERTVFYPTPEMERFLDEFYFAHYVKNFFYTSKFTEAMTTIPFSFIVDDHDIFDGWGSYPVYLHDSRIFQMIKFYAFKYYHLFQAHTNYDLARSHGYFGKLGYNWIKQLGPFTTLLGADTRYERTLKQVILPESYDMIFERLHNLPPTTKHMFLITGVPLVYPRLTMVEGALSFMVSSKLKNLSIFQKDGALSSITNKFGEPELLDDLNDHWTAGIHMDERKILIERMQDFARVKQTRVTLVAGDVHCCGIGRFASTQKSLDEANDFRMMPQIISSAIMNIPPPNAVIRMAHYSAKTYDLNGYTNEKMYEMFSKDVNEKHPPNNNKKLLARRNYSSFVEDLATGNYLILIHAQMETNVGTKAYPFTVPPLSVINNMV